MGTLKLPYPPMHLTLLPLLLPWTSPSLWQGPPLTPRFLPPWWILQRTHRLITPLPHPWLLAIVLGTGQPLIVVLPLFPPQPSPPPPPPLPRPPLCLLPPPPPRPPLCLLLFHPTIGPILV
ncbi:hypothetical protein AMTRI_Chr13g89590 [Amborella trichopoda]